MKRRITLVLITLSLVLNSWPVFTSRAASKGQQVGKPFRLPAMAAGSYHSLALKNDSTVVAWGNNANGQTTVPAGLTGVTAIAAGIYHSLALRSNGSVVAWGGNNFGQATVPTGLSGVIAIATGRGHSLALKSNGTVVAWGSNDNRQATVPAGLSGVTAIAGGYDYSLATTLIADVAPTIAVTNITSEAGASIYSNLKKTTFQVATVSDRDDGISSLTVAITKLSGANITVESLGHDASGKLTVRVYTKCQGATKSTFALTVTDPGGKSATANLIVTPVRSSTIAHCIPG